MRNICISKNKLKKNVVLKTMVWLEQKNPAFL